MIGEYAEQVGKYANPEMNAFRESRVGIEPEQPKNIGTELGELRNSLEKAHELFSVLEDRTRPIRYATPQCAEKEGKPVGGGSDLRGALADQNMRLRALVSRIACMIDEIDL